MSQSLKSDKLQLAWQENFKEIQCYQDEQVNTVLKQLLSSKELIETLTDLFSSHTKIKIDLSSLENIKSIANFQTWVESTFFPLVSPSFESLSFSGLEQLNPSDAYVFVSNHRDIVMDPLLLNRALRKDNFSTANCAIGDNLLSHPSANDLALLNRCFKVFRSLKSPRAMLKAMKVQSEYIRYLHFTKNENVWIAQKEGRAKDNIDKTNPALIKMFGLAKPKDIDLAVYLSGLNIVPVSFSYEWDPCDLDKAKEIYETELNGQYVKSKVDDFISTKKGLTGFKGNIHVSFGKALDINELDDHKSIAVKIDDSIRRGYRAYPINYACYKKIYSKLPEDCPFDKQVVNTAGKSLEEKLANHGDELKKIVYQAYSQVIS